MEGSSLVTLQAAARLALESMRDEEAAYREFQREARRERPEDAMVLEWFGGRGFRPRPLQRGIPRSLDGKGLEKELKAALKDVAGGAQPETILIANRNLASWCARFLKQFYREVLDIVCTKRGDSIARAADLPSKGTVTALAAWLTSSAGMTSPVSLGIAVVLLMTISSAAKGAFCSMAREQFEQHLPD